MFNSVKAECFSSQKSNSCLNTVETGCVLMQRVKEAIITTIMMIIIMDWVGNSFCCFYTIR